MTDASRVPSSEAVERETERILWRRLDPPGHEIGRLTHAGEGWELSGTAIFAHDHTPCGLDYLVVCDHGFRTMSAHVSGMIGDTAIDLSVSVDERQRWLVDGTQCPAVDDCVDIDLGFSPATNLLPIRRLALDIGQEAEVMAAWLPFPSLTFEVLPQVYRRVGETTYRYEAFGGTFVRELQVNETGFVTTYPGLWRAEPTT